MKLPLQITFRNMESSEAMEANIRQKAEKLDQICQEIMSCRVMVEASHHHHHQGNLYHVRLDVTMPGGEIAVSRDAHEKQSHEDVYVAIRDAFDAARRQLEGYADRRKRETKAHSEPPHGRIIELVPMEDYGRIATADGREIYFHRNSLLNGDLDDLDVGQEVSFAVESGEQGPQASSVRLVGKHHYVT